MRKRAFITGITGQDGSYLAELLLSKGYEVHGLIRRASTFNTSRIQHIYQDPHDPRARLFLHYGDLANLEQLMSVIYDLRPDEVYHLGAQSHVKVSFDMPEYTGDIAGLGTTRILEAIRRSGLRSRVYQASSSEMFGDAPAPQSERSPFCPKSPYAAAKVYAHWMVVTYRGSYDLFACNGILFNHESPRRGETFVTRKITRAVAAILGGRQQDLYLGNLDARRDWGYAPEYVEGMWLMLQQERPHDYVLGTGESHSVQEFVEEAFGYVGLDWRRYVKVEPRYFRPIDVENLVADPARARKELRWEPRVTFKELVRLMVDADTAAAGLEPPGEGSKIMAQKCARWHRWDSSVVPLLKASPQGVE
ncbi:MAG TPA: GDP-mannose 4,6-dehydratase [bacterium]|nr:GDP-mannose 4,6-dehydratase [bacterium]